MRGFQIYTNWRIGGLQGRTGNSLLPGSQELAPGWHLLRQ
jgi:hypothetical protein